MTKDVAAELKMETEKWRKKAEAAVKEVWPIGKKGDELLQNIRAYLADSAHFEKNNELVKAFEAVVWAWALLEMGKEFNVFKTVNSA